MGGQFASVSGQPVASSRGGMSGNAMLLRDEWKRAAGATALLSVVIILIMFWLS